MNLSKFRQITYKIKNIINTYICHIKYKKNTLFADEILLYSSKITCSFYKNNNQNEIK